MLLHAACYCFIEVSLIPFSMVLPVVQVVKEFASRWQVPLPQLRILNLALCFFARASTVFTSNCEHVLQTISSIAL